MAPTAVEEFDDYEVLGEIARGGMGVVYRALQKKANRIVALKMILSNRYGGESEILRFRNEAEAAALLDHPNIVPVFDVGEQDGNPYFTMGLVEGESLSAKTRLGPMPTQEAAKLLVSNLRRDRIRSRKRCDPSRPQAVEYSPRSKRKTTHYGFRISQTRGGRTRLDGDRPNHGNAKLHATGAGTW